MAKITYSSLKLKTNTETKKIEGTDIEILKYLPIEEKISLIDIALQNAKEGTVYNATKLDAYFHLYIVMMYSNITFTEKQKEDPMKLYDALKSTGLLDKIIINMEEDEYNYLLENLNQQEEDYYQYKNSFSGTIANLVDQLPAKAEQLTEIMQNFEPSKFQNVIDFAKAANGGRSIIQ